MNMQRKMWIGLVCALAMMATACGGSDSAKKDAAKDKKPAAEATPKGDKKAEAPKAGDKKSGADSKTPANLQKGLLIGLSRFELNSNKKPVKPGPARLVIVTRENGEWKQQYIDDSESNVFHKAFYYDGPDAKPGIVTLGGQGAAVKIWRKDGADFKAKTLWSKDFGGKFNRMRDAEVADLFGDGKPSIAVATHDQGVVAVLKPKGGDQFEVIELDKKEKTFVHEIEIGDVNGDKALEVYATPSEPNRFDGHAQTGQVMRYVPSKAGSKGEVAADLGNRHAKEILVADVDGDGKDELYVALEAEIKDKKVVTPVEIRRYDADTDPKKGTVIADLDDRLCRFLTYGDVDGDGKKEMVAAPLRSGLWLLRPGAKPASEKWEKTLIDKDSSGFEHTSLLTDLDGDGKDELYVASDDQGEVRRYTWNGKGFDKEVISKREVPRELFTWNMMPVPVEVLKK